MPIITSSHAITRRQKSGNYVQFTHIDHLGSEHKTIEMKFPADHDLANEVKVSADIMTESLMDLEFVSALESLKNGANPFRNGHGEIIQPKHHSSYESLIALTLSSILSLDLGAALEYRAAADLVTNLSDAQISALGLDLANVRNWVSAMTALNNSMSEWGG